MTHGALGRTSFLGGGESDEMRHQSKGGGACACTSASVAAGEVELRAPSALATLGSVTAFECVVRRVAGHRAQERPRGRSVPPSHAAALVLCGMSVQKGIKKMHDFGTILRSYNAHIRTTHPAATAHRTRDACPC